MLLFLLIIFVFISSVALFCLQFGLLFLKALLLLALLAVLDQLNGCLGRLTNNEVRVRQKVLNTLLVVQVHPQANQNLMTHYRCLLWILYTFEEIGDCRHENFLHLANDKGHLMLEKVRTVTRILRL